jgi:hypothetical protein
MKVKCVSFFMVGFYLIISIPMNVFTISVRIPIEAALLIKKGCRAQRDSLAFSIKTDFSA